VFSPITSIKSRAPLVSMTEASSILAKSTGPDDDERQPSETVTDSDNHPLLRIESKIDRAFNSCSCSGSDDG
jgi:hypothetical protein